MAVQRPRPRFEPRFIEQFLAWLLYRLRKTKEEIKEEAEKNGENPVTVKSIDKVFCVSLPLQSHSVIQTQFSSGEDTAISPT